MTVPKFRLVSLMLVATVALCSCRASGTRGSNAREAHADRVANDMRIQYLEVVTPDVDATCAAFEKLHGVVFGAPEALLGNARTATLKNASRVGVRAPMAEHESPIVRPYVLVDDIDAAVKAAAAAGGQIAVMPTEITGQGRFAIYFLGGVQYGLWEL